MGPWGWDTLVTDTSMTMYVQTKLHARAVKALVRNAVLYEPWVLTGALNTKVQILLNCSQMELYCKCDEKLKLER